MTRSAALAAPLLGGAARVAVGVLWLLEGLEKYRAGFGASDILLVADGAARTPRTPWWFSPLDAGMQAFPALFGFVIPALEVALGLLLIAGLFTRLAALASIATLMLYWSSDQLVDQYPVMVLLSAVVLAVPGAGRYGVGMLRRHRTRIAAPQK
ncbi:DoxX family membrane protein [Microbacterium sp. NPDC057650]|uniref:DoxX family membrane protein n=1 Tax=unclassified Microbacterium TaxID=2609290 RepID=UPI00366AF594